MMEGIYYTKNIINIAKKYINVRNENYSVESISENIYLFHNVLNNYCIERELISYLQWLKSDTLMIWNIENV